MNFNGILPGLLVQSRHDNIGIYQDEGLQFSVGFLDCTDVALFIMAPENDVKKTRRSDVAFILSSKSIAGFCLAAALESCP